MKARAKVTKIPPRAEVSGWADPVAKVEIKRGKERAVFIIRVRIPDDPRAGVEGAPYLSVYTATGRESTKEVRGYWTKEPAP